MTLFSIFDRKNLLLILCRVLAAIETCPQFLGLSGRGRRRRNGNSSGTTRSRRNSQIWLNTPILYQMVRTQRFWKSQLCVNSTGIFSWTLHIKPNPTSILGFCKLCWFQIDLIVKMTDCIFFQWRILAQVRIRFLWGIGTSRHLSGYSSSTARDNCQCSKCIHPDTKQRAVYTFAVWFLFAIYY